MLTTILLFILAIIILVGVHEFGHFWVARLCGIKVLRFAIGFGRKLWSVTDKKGTEYVLAAIPLGGYVKMLDEREGEVDKSELHKAFNNQTLLKRSAVVIAGPLFNFIFAIIAYWLVFIVGIEQPAPVVSHVISGSMADRAGLIDNSEFLQINGHKTSSWKAVQTSLLKSAGMASIPVQTKALTSGATTTINLDVSQLDWNKPESIFTQLGLEVYVPDYPPIIADVLPGEAAELAGLLAGDKFLIINGKPVDSWEDVFSVISANPNKPITLKLDRSGQIINKKVTPGSKIHDEKTIGFIGVQSQPARWSEEMLRRESHGPIMAFAPAWQEFKHGITVTVVVIKKLLLGEVPVSSVGGPVSIAQWAGVAGKSGFSYFLDFLAIISINLGLINLLPIPIFDGGHLVYFLIEAIMRRPLPERAYVLGNYIGLVFVTLLMGLVFYNDFVRLFA